MNSDEFAYQPISRLSRLIATSEKSPVDVTRAALDRVASLDRFGNAFLEVLEEDALVQARRAESEISKGIHRGPMHGIPVALKDLCDIEGTITTAGAVVLGDEPARSDSELARRFRIAGAILIGKTNLHEFAYGGTGVNPHFGTPPNPWGLDRVPGGSSSGSAVAVATGTVPAAIGSDTGGSIRLPASHCGITGLKPTFGRVSRRGVFPLSMSLDTVGPMTRSALDCALMMEVIAGFDPGDPYSSRRKQEVFSAGIDVGIRGRRIGVPRSYFFDELEADVEASVRKALITLEELGAHLVDIDIPWAQEAFDNNLSRTEAVWIHRRRIDDPDVSEKLGKDTLTRLRDGRSTDAAEYHRQLDGRFRFTSLAETLMNDVDLVATPAAPSVAGKIAHVDTLKYRRVLRFTAVFNQTWQPSLSIPCGFDGQRLPVGLMLTGAMWSERLVLRAGHAYQLATDFHDRKPPTV